MATAIEVDVPVTTYEKGVQLNLSMKEAEAICSILYHVGGDPDTTNRQYSDKVWNALRELGVNVNFDLQGNLWFVQE